MPTDVRSYSGSRYPKPPLPSGGTLDAPDQTVRRALLKREMGQPLSSKELNRVANRMSVEAETGRTGGVVRSPITPRRISPFDAGRQMRAEDDQFAAGYQGSQPGAAAPSANAGQVAPTAKAPAPAMGAAPAPAGQALPSAAPAAPVQRRQFGAPQKLNSPVAPAVGAGPGGSYVGGGGNYMAEFGTKKSAMEFADFAARQTKADTPPTTPVRRRTIAPRQ